MLHDLIRREGAAQTARLATPRFGIVSAVDPVNHAVKVIVQPEGVESGWIPDPGFGAGTLRVSSPCEVGTQVLVTPAEGDAEHPVVTGRVFDAEVAPGVSPATGQVAQPGEWLMMAGQAGPPESGAKAAQDAAWTHLTPTTAYMGAGSVMLAVTNGAITITIGGMTARFSSAGLVVTGGDVTASGISLDQHVHGGVQSGTSMTGRPEG